MSWRRFTVHADTIEYHLHITWYSVRHW